MEGCNAGAEAAVAAAVVTEAAAAVVAPVVGLGAESSEGPSHASSTTDCQLADTAEQPLNKTHHLLRHCLNQGQRSEALQHFGTADVKEAAREISRMGQRELQAKFKLVYGSTTHSNNNDWLRRKLFEAIGAAPLKANSKGKARSKPSTPRARKPAAAAQQAEHQQPGCAGGAAAAGGYSAGVHQQPMLVPTSPAATRSSLRAVPKGPAHLGASLTAGAPRGAAQRPQRAGAPRRMACFPGSPPLSGHSVLDVHRYQQELSGGETASDSEGGVCEGRGEGAEARSVRSVQGYPSSAHVPYYAPQPQPAPAPRQLPQLQLLAPVPTQCGVGALGLGTLDLGLGLQVGTSDWLPEAWSDPCDILGGARPFSGLGVAVPAAPAADPSQPGSPLAPSSVADDDDVLLLPMDFSAIDTFAFA